MSSLFSGVRTLDVQSLVCCLQVIFRIQFQTAVKLSFTAYATPGEARVIYRHKERAGYIFPAALVFYSATCITAL